MTPQRLQQIEEIFSRVLELPRVQRDDALQVTCGSDGMLRAEVESLLKHADPPDAFLSDSALGASLALPAFSPPEDDLDGARIGPYRVVHRRASGGMGTVYRAVRADGQFDQQVAIKVVKRGMDTEEILHRFALERNTLATLQHPNIARLLDAGAMPNGRPYLVMEYVEGVPIDQYCDDHRLPISQRLRLFSVVCEAVRLAHQKLVIHRDLKPGNILVNDSGDPKLLDFGVSKVLVGTGSVDVTAVEERRFTPEYASPEQVSGLPLSTASDVYSLGIILFELLTGRRPYRFSTRSVAEVSRVVCEEEIAPPSVAVRRGDGPAASASSSTTASEAANRRREATTERLGRRLAGDLDTIVLKATYKDPARRYASVEQLVADIERHLAGLPVLARPDTIAYRVQKFVRRHALAAALGVAAVLLLAVGFGVAVWEGRAARRERDAAYLARDQAEATADFMQRMMSAADPVNEGPDATVRSVLDVAALRVDSDLKSQPLVQAAVRSTIGRTYLGLGLLEPAESNINAAKAIRAAQLEPGHHDLAESEFDQAQLYYAQGKFTEAEALLAHCLETHRRLRGAENLDTARVLNDLGAVQRAAGKIAEAESTHREALVIREKLAGRESLEVAESLNNLAGALRAKGDIKGALELITEVLETRRKLLREEHPLVLQSMANLGVLASALGDHRLSEKLLREVVRLDRKVFGDQHPTLAVDLSGLGRMLLQQGRYSEAEPLLRESLEIRRGRLTPEDERLLKTQASLGECLAALGRDHEAELLLEDALQKTRVESRTNDSFWIGIADALDKLRHRRKNP
ncbi:MAG TPA: serine/threonine-protein kinase [Phycisphaerae bacterium]|nr:serine/threonine-protein kinase [Phycisphaerae bacterium]